jgi:putative tricarboxylic transport membrane protein
VTRDKGNLISGACLAAFGIYVISVAAKLPYVSDVGPGPGFFPLWLGIGMVLLASWLILTSAGFASAKTSNEATSWKGSGRSLAGWLALIVTVALLGKLGFGLSFILLTVFLIVALDRRPLRLAVGIAVALTAAFYLIFVAALEVSLPKGPWGF